MALLSQIIVLNISKGSFFIGRVASRRHRKVSFTYLRKGKCQKQDVVVGGKVVLISAVIRHFQENDWSQTNECFQAGMKPTI